LAFLLRALLLFKNRWVGIDTLGYLAFALEYKKKKNIVEQIDKTPGGDFIPPLYPAFLSLFPKKFFRQLQFLSTIVDLLALIFLYYFTLSFGENVALLASLIYALSPVVVYSCFSLSPRSFSNTFLIFSMVSLFYYLNGNPFFLLPFFISTAIILLSHRMTTQAIVIVIVLESVFFFNLVPIAILLLAVAFWRILLGKTYFRFLKNHIDRLIMYAKSGGYRERRVKPDSPLRIISTFPLTLLILANAIYFGLLGGLFLNVWFLSLLIASSIWTLGDGFRYMTNAVFPGSILAALVLSNTPNSLLILSIFLLISIFAIYRVIKLYQTSHRVISKDVVKCFDFVRKNAKPNDTLLFLPFEYQYAYVANFFTDLNIIGYSKKDYDEKDVAKGKLHGKKINWIVTNSNKAFNKSRFKLRYRSNGFSAFKQ